jgi:hypothetical protein
MKTQIRGVLVLAMTFVAGFVARGALTGEDVAHAQAKPRVYELRTYTAVDGKLDELHGRFREHVLRFFQKHGMTDVVNFKPIDAPLSQTTLIYLLSHESREAAAKSWAAFRADPEWRKVSAGGPPLTSKVESVFLEPTDYSPMK